MSSNRRSIEIETFVHANPIPSACRIGPLLTSSIVVGRDPGGNDVPDAVAAQIENLFRHVDAMLDAAGARWEHVAKMNFWVPSLDDRSLINVPWIDHFPDPTSRPGRHTQVGSSVAQCDFTAYVTD